ncbi:MAG TPA: protein kinase [Gemmatimonadaceae bacterium]|nr:protein kinase [Gemmatimonadaceae bacterium]
MTARDEKALLRERVEQAVGTLFEIEDEIGRGGMAVVYRARDVRLRRKVALKVLPPELAYREDVKNRFLREAQMSAQLSHPNIVPIYTVDEIEGIVFFAMGLVEGETLAQQLAREPRPSVPRVRDLLRSVADALAYAHARHVVHRDVKPDNILVERATGRALVSDFGIARAAEGDSRLTVTGVAVGTPAYMSPEQAMGEREVDGRADIYSLGVVGYQMLAGELPFQAANTPAMLMKHISERPRPLHEQRQDLAPNLVYAIERAMAKGRTERWPDASAFRDALDEHAVVDSLRERPRPSFGPQRDAVANQADQRPDENRLKAGDESASREPYPRFPALPPGWMFNPNTREYGKDALREWREEQRRWRDQVRGKKRNQGIEIGVVLGTKRYGTAEGGLAIDPYSRRELRRAERAGLVQVTPEERIRRAQRSLIGYATTVGFLFAINMITSPQFPWFVFPALAMGIGVIGKVSSLWVDGIPVHRLFRRQPHTTAPGGGERAPGDARAAPTPRIAAADVGGVPREVLDGPHGGAIREAAEAKAIITDVLAKLSDADRKMLPEIQPTVDALVDRIRSLAQSLHQLDGDASASAIAKLELRINQTTAAAASMPATDGERRLELLLRQLATLKDLSARRETVAQQMESASVVLQTMKLDLLKLRSSGLDSKLDASTGATQEARALSTDIGRVIEAANEVRKL